MAETRRARAAEFWDSLLEGIGREPRAAQVDRILAFARSERALALEEAAEAEGSGNGWRNDLRDRAAQERGGGDGR